MRASYPTAAGAVAHERVFTPLIGGGLLDAAHRGLGTASCGPDTLPRYRLGAGAHRWSWTLRPP
ncbi:hypothetical protein ACFXBB_18155 [Streptomyces scopuliridis]|uniref:hypothetical protein n=1 Tax=Streptomyces scopuliridis TaxID=452529 RepID=UPI0036C12D3A